MTKTINRRQFLTIGSAVVGASLLAACGATPTPTPVPPTAVPTKPPATATTAPVAAPTATTAPTAVPTAVPTKAPTVAPTAPPAAKSDKLIAVSGTGSNVTVRNFNPFVSTSAMLGAASFAYEPLVIVNAISGDIVPWLATSYKFSDDVKSLTFTLREGVKWSDGKPFTANDVVFTFMLLRTKPGLQGVALSAMNPQAGYVDTVTAPDAKTVVFTFKRPYSLAIYELGQQPIVPEHIWKDIADPSKFTNENPVGTGPFTEIKNFTSAQYEIHANPYYWQADKIAFGGFKVTYGLSPDAQELAIVNGNYDWTGAPLVDIDKVYVAKDPANRYYWFPATSNILALYLLTPKKPFDDANVRKAISMAINRQQIIEVAQNGVGHPCDVTGLSDGMASLRVPDPKKLGNWTDLNVDQANKLLDAAGLKKGSDGIRVLSDGTPMKFALTVVSSFTNQMRAADIIVQNLKAVGVGVSVKPLDFGTAYQAIMKGDYEMALFFAGGTTPYHFYYATMSPRSFTPVGQMAYFGNYIRFTDAKAEELLKQWEATTDPAKQKEISFQLQQVFADQAPLLPLYAQPMWMIFKTNNFTGFPSKDNPYALGTLDNSNTNLLLVFQRIKPR